MKAERREFTLPEGVKSPKNKRFIILYCACLFLFAAGIVLMSYLAHERTYSQMLGEEVERESQRAVSATRTVQELQEENLRLNEENGILEERILALEDAVRMQQDELNGLSGRIEESTAEDAAARKELEEKKTLAEKRSEALDCLWQLEKFYSWGAYSSAREVDSYMKEKGLVDFLSAEKGTDGVSAVEEYGRLTGLIY